MNSTIDRPWYTTRCVPFLSIEGCPSDSYEARRIWAAVYLALDISTLFIVGITLIRRWLYVVEPFNTIRLMLIKFLLSLPLHFTWDTARVFGGSTQFGFGAFTMSAFIAISFLPGIAAIGMLASTWLTLGRESVSTRHPILGSAKIYVLLVVPSVISIITTGICGAISYTAYNICWRIFFVSWVWFSFTLATLTIINCVRNLRRFHSEDHKFHRGQLIRTTIGIAIIFFGAGAVCGFQAIFLTQIDNSTAGWLGCYGLYRVFFWFVLNGGALYAWVVTTYRIQVESSGSTVRSSTAVGLPGRSDDSLKSPYGCTSPRPMSLEERNLDKNLSKTEPI